MVDDVELRLKNALRHLGPTAAADADLVTALAEAEREPVRRRPILAYALVGAAAAVLIALGVGFLRRQPSSELGRTAPIAPAEARVVRVMMSADGTVDIDAPALGARANVRFGTDPTGNTVALNAIRTALQVAADRAERSPDDNSILGLSIEAEPLVRWRWIQWTLQAAASPKARIHEIHFGSTRPGEPPITHFLPTDRGAADVRTPDAPTFVVTLVSDPYNLTRVLVTGHNAIVEDSSVAESSNPIKMQDAMVKNWSEGIRSGSTDPATIGELRYTSPRTTWSTDGGGTTYFIVEAVLRAFREAGVKDVRFSGAEDPEPTPR